jgi:hypothetical protein
MSSISRWSYKNTAIVRPFEGEDLFNGGIIYGDPYEIACTWVAKAEQRRMVGGQSGASGGEFVSRYVIYTEDQRPKYRDRIELNGIDTIEEIRLVTNYDMSPFGEADSPDFELVT